MSEPISIVQYWGGCPTVPNSRWQRFVRLAERCAERSWRTCLVWSRMPADPALVTPFTDADCRMEIRPRAKGNFDPACVARTVRLLRRYRCDILHCHNIHTSPLLAGFFARVPVRVWSKLSMSRHYEEGAEPRGVHGLQLSTRLSVRLSHRVFCLSEAVRQELLAVGAPQGKLTVTPVPIDIDRFRNADRAGLREELGLTDAHLLVTAVGHAVPVKGWDVLLRAFAKIIDAIPHARLLLVGSTDAAHEREMTRQLREIARTSRIEENVLWLGPRQDIPRILAGSDIFAFPSRSEGAGCALHEALAAGVACVASRAGGAAEAIEHRHSGLLVEREDVDALADALVELAGDEALRQRLARNAQPLLERHGLEAQTDRMMAEYEALLIRSGRLDPARTSTEASKASSS